MKTPGRAALSVLITLAFLTSVNGATFQGLGLGPSAGALDSEARAVSADGTTVVGASTMDQSGDQAWRWNACTGMVRLDTFVGIFGVERRLR